MIRTMHVHTATEAAGVPGESVLDRTVGATMARSAQSTARQSAVLGECLDVGRGDQAGQLLVLYENESGRPVRRWLDCLRDVKAAAGDRLLLLEIRSGASPIVVGALAQRGQPIATSQTPQVVLREGESLRVATVDGQELAEIRSGEAGATIRLAGADVDLQLPGKLRIAAEKIDLQSRAEMRLQSGDDVVVRGTYIRLN